MKDFCNNSVTKIQIISVIQPQFAALSPVDGEIGVQISSSLFEWAPISTTIRSDVFVWNAANATRPSTPVCTTTVSRCYINLAPFSNLTWQVDFYLPGLILHSPVYHFTTVDQADLFVNSITVPPVAYSANTISVDWSVQNSRSEAVHALSWYDAVFVSRWAVWPGRSATDHVQLNIVPNPIFLDAQDGYTQHFVGTLPASLYGGTFYVYIITDTYNSVPEYNEGNNIARSSGFQINLAPQSDLRGGPTPPANMIVPTNVFSGSSMNVNYRFVNAGAGFDAVWSDCFYFSRDVFYNISDSWLTSVSNKMTMNTSQQVNQTVSCTLPQAIWGTFYILIRLNCWSSISELGLEDNNLMVSAPINVILTPPPDMQAVNLTSPSTTFTGANVTFTYTASNVGPGLPFESNWEDRISIVSGATTLEQTTFWITASEGRTYTRSWSYLIPQTFNGSYEVVVSTDYRNKVFEYDKENNNELRMPMVVAQRRPDLMPAQLNAVSLIYSGNSLDARWTVINLGWPTQVSWKDALRFCHSGNCTNFEFEQEQVLGSNISYTRNFSLVVPPTAVGLYSLSIVVDYLHTVIEADENNNQLTLPINITRAWADLTVSGITVQLPAVACTPINVSWTVANVGLAGTNTSQWFDCLYWSRAGKVVSPTFKVLRKGPLLPGNIYVGNTAIEFCSLAFGIHKLFVNPHCDVPLWETNTANNLGSTSVHVTPAARVNLVPVETQVDVSGVGLLTVTITVQNQGNHGQQHSWVNQLFLSQWSDILDISNATNPNETYSNVASRSTLIGTFNSSLRTFAPGANISLEQSVVLPNWLGRLNDSFYAYVVVDALNEVDELEGESDNVARSAPFVLRQPARVPDLSVVVLTVSPNASLSGSSVTVSFRVTNKDLYFPTKATSWEDRVEFTVGSGVVASSTVLRLGPVLPNAYYIQTAKIGRAHV